MWMMSLKNQKEKLQEEIEKLNSQIRILNTNKEKLETEIKYLKNEKDKIDKDIRNRQKFFIEHELLSIDTMSGIEFEDYFTILLNKMGYIAKGTKATSDEGADIIAEKDNVKYVFQCKNYSSSVGNKAVQEVYTAQGIYKCDKAIVITNNYYTKQAVKEAEILSIILWDRDVLEKILYQVYEFDMQNLEERKLSYNKNTVYEEDDKSDNEIDPLLMDGIDVAVQLGEISTSLIQRKFKVGYSRAAYIIDQMEERGIISGYQGSKPRGVLISKEQWKEMKKDNLR